ncbi:hypothetical protein QBC47DRAFT_401692 [Echria macrotheca]|uniref:Uncharacterized protein n=1 Tax=Echria macrotheca TaxID=438768 RepID=A0AAJ0BC39_9PEZI|nr:hypothetical protein QBC47DRAFT_401692 [Echria macrotheca]
MTRFGLVLAAAVALASTASAKAGFKKPCPVDIDICGWALQSDYGYENEVLSDATYAANQDPGKGTIVFDSIYNCYPDGEIVWSAWCGGGGLCDKAVSPSAPALCKGEPVDTGRAPPTFPDEGETDPGADQGEPYNPDDPYYGDAVGGAA